MSWKSRHDNGAHFTPKPKHGKSKSNGTGSTISVGGKILSDGMRMNNRKKLPEIDIREKDWGIEIDSDDNMKLQLGNLTDEGWYWNGDKNDLTGFLIRVASSNFENDFKKQMIHHNVDFSEMKKIMLDNLKKSDDGIYMLSGDNTLWKFGDGYEFDADSEGDGYDRYDRLTDEQKHEVENEVWNHYGIDYDEFLKSSSGISTKNKLIEIIKESNSFDGFFTSLQNNDQFFNEESFNYQSENFRDALDKAIDEVTKH